MIAAVVVACTPEERGRERLALALAPDAEVPSVLVGALTGAGPRAAAEVEDADGAVHPLPLGGTGAVRVVGLPAGEPFTVRVTDGARTLVLDGEAPAAGGLPEWDLSADDVDPGLVLAALTSPDGSALAVLDGRARYRWWWFASPDRTLAGPRPSQDGTAVLATSQDRLREDAMQVVHRVAWDGSARAETALEGAHHMVEELPDGGFLWPAWDVRDVPWPDEPAPVMGDRVLRGRGVPVGADADPGAEELFSWFDDHGPAEVPCEHGLLRVSRLGEPVYEWTHTNSVVVAPDTGDVLVNSRLTDTLLALDPATGDVRWQLGGEGATVPFADPADAFSHAHFSHVADRRLLVFDNGVHHDPPASRVVEYALPPTPGDGDPVAVVREVALGGFWDYLGDARWRADGGLWVAVSDPGALRVYDARDRLAWEARVRSDGGRRSVVVGRIRELAPPPWP